MKLIYFSSATVPSKTANSIHIMKMCSALVQRGCDVTLFAFVDKAYSREDILAYYDIKYKFKIKSLRSRIPLFSGLWNGLYMAFSSLIISPKFILGRDLKACYFGALFGQKIYFEIHAPIDASSMINNRLYKWMVKKKSFQKTVLITKSLQRYYEENYPETTNNILVLPDGADKVNASEITRLKVRKPDKINIGYTGHLYAGKGMEIIAELLPRCPFAHFHIVGGREEDVLMWNYLEKYENITFYGYVDHASIKNYIADFDIVLLPNQRVVKSNAGKDIGRWTSPLKLFEYMAMGKPIICSDIEVLKEIAKNLENSLICNPDDINEWVNAIQLLSTDTQLAQKLGEMARSDFESNYTWSHRAFRLIEDFERNG